MSVKLSSSLSRLTLACLVASFALASDSASARPGRARVKQRAAQKIDKRVVEVSKAHIERGRKAPARARPGGSAPTTGPGSVQYDEPDELKFELSANTPHFPYRGRLIGYYPREWRTAGDALGPGGEIWVSQNRVPHGSYVEAKLNVEPGHDYEVTLCTSSGDFSEMVRVTLGDAVHTFPAGNAQCDMTLVVKPEDAGWITIKIDFANGPKENHSNAYAIHRVEVVRRPGA